MLSFPRNWKSFKGVQREFKGLQDYAEVHENFKKTISVNSKYGGLEVQHKIFRQRLWDKSSSSLASCHTFTVVFFTFILPNIVINCLYLSGEWRILQGSNSGPTTSNIGRNCRELKHGGECENQQSGLLHGDLKTLQAEVNWGVWERRSSFPHCLLTSGV